MTKQHPEEQKLSQWLGSRFSSEVALRVGNGPRERLRWLACDFPKYEEDQLDQALLEAAIFIVLQAGPGSLSMNRRPPVTDEELLMLIEHVGNGISSFVDKGRFPTIRVGKPMALDVYRDGRPPPPGTTRQEVWSTWSRAFGVSDGESFRLVFLLAAAELLGREGASLARCRFHECGNFFVRQNPRQLYCSAAHANREHQRRHRSGETSEENE
jgi:hypothetical protein